MTSQALDEETPLLDARNKKRTPLPWGQFSIILALHLAEPLSSQVIAPFVPQLIRDIGVTNGDETQVGYYVGLLHSLYFATQALTILHWSRLSDHIGRKPVVLIGLCGLSVSMYCFGLSKTFWGLVMSRFLDASLNGNLGVIKSMIVEITDSTNLAQAYAFMPIAWSAGISLGPYIGGALSNPADQFPSVFGNWAFFKEYPYFLACAIPATCSVLTWLATYLFLKETRGRPISLSQLFGSLFSAKRRDSPAPDSSGGALGNEHTRIEETPLPLRSLMIPRVLIAAGNYATLSLLEVAFRAMQPVFFSTPIELGGLGLDPPRIGNILSIYGVANGLFQALFFANLHDRFGSKAILSVAVASGIPLALTFPLLNALARAQGLSWMVWFVVGVHIAFAMAVNMGYSCVFIYIAASSPNQASLGATTGIAQLLVSAVLTVGPAATASMFSMSTKSPERAWFAYYFILLLDGIAIGASLLLPRKVWTRSTD